MYIINNKEFKNKGAITEHFRGILHNSKVGKPLEHIDFMDVCELLKHHIEYDKKVGIGIKSITIEFHKDLLTNKIAKYPHFQINRIDGSSIDFSFVKSISYINSGKTIYSEHFSDIKKCMRFIVKPQIDDFRDKCFSKKTYLVCPILNINFSIKTCHIDHAPPKTFDVLIFDFLNENNLKFNDIEIHEINGIFSTFKDIELREKWFNYHKEFAILRATHQAGNLSQKKVNIDWSCLI